MSDEPRAGTTAALDARVGRLESQFDRLDAKVDTLSVDVARVLTDFSHLSQLISTQYQAIMAEIGLQRTRYHEVNNIIQKAMGDPSDTPAGRAIVERLDRVDRDKKDAHDELTGAIDEIKGEVRGVREANTKLRLWVASATGAVGVIVFLLDFFGPAIRRAVGLP